MSAMHESTGCEETLVNAVIRGPLLDAYLDEVEALADEPGEGSNDEASGAETLQAKLAAMLGRQHCEADSMDSLRRLYRLYLRAGDTTMALHVIDIQGAGLCSALPEEERAEADVSLAFWRLHALQAKHRETPQSLPGGDAAAVAETARLLDALPVDRQSDDAWACLADYAEEADNHTLVRQCCNKRHALAALQPERARFRAWDAAFLQIRLAKSFATEGESAKARSAVDAAFDGLKNAAADQDVDHNDWLGLGEQALQLFPACFTRIRDEVRAHLVVDNCPPAQRREVEVQLARLEAGALYREGKLVEALEKSREGRFGLSGEDSDDEFSVQVIDWLLEAGRRAEAARLAFESAFNERADSGPYACRLALQQVQDPALTDAYWPLTLAYCAISEDLQWVMNEENPAAFFARHLELASRLMPDHPAIGLLRAINLVRKSADFAQALPLLEKAAQLPELATPLTLESLWTCRIRLYGLEKGLAQPYVDASSGGWCYNMGVWLNSFLRNQLPAGSAWPAAQAEALGARYYESALRYFETFIVSGKGTFRDGNVHVYSMLCNNLAIYYRIEKNAYKAGAELHVKGIAASPFAEHHEGLMWCYYKADLDAAFIDAADQLWHFAADHGYSRHIAANYVPSVCRVLEKLGRPHEIAIWLQRLDEWWASLDAAEQSENERGYHDALVLVLWRLVQVQPEDAGLRMQRSLAAIRSMEVPLLSRDAALVLEEAGNIAEALKLSEEASAMLAREGAQADRELIKLLKEKMAQLRAMLRPRPWWKFWG